MKKRILTSLLLLMFISTTLFAANTVYYGGTVTDLETGCVYKFAAAVDWPHGTATYSGPCGSGTISWMVVNEDDELEPVENWDEAVALYNLEVSAGTDLDAALVVFNEIASNPDF